MRFQIRRFQIRGEFLLVLGFFLFAWGCGGGGSQGAPVGPARVSIDVSPSVIDSGDRTEVQIIISDFGEDGLAIKIRYPVALSYVVESALYELDGEFFDTGPDENETDSTNNYLVFYLDPDDFVGDLDEDVSSLALLLELEGVSSVQDAVVAVDLDIDNPDVSNSTEFSVTDPRFDAQEQDDIRVGDFTNASSSSSSGAA